jgi:hypothetical protein
MHGLDERTDTRRTRRALLRSRELLENENYSHLHARVARAGGVRTVN